ETLDRAVRRWRGLKRSDNHSTDEILRAVRVQVGCGAAPVPDTVEYAGCVVDPLRRDVTYHLNAHVAVRHEARRERAFWEQHIGVADLQLVSYWRLVLSRADAEVGREENVQVRIG